MATRYALPLRGLLTWKSENTGSAPAFFSVKGCSRPNCRRSSRCHASSDMSAGLCRRESCLVAADTFDDLPLPLSQYFDDAAVGRMGIEQVAQRRTAFLVNETPDPISHLFPVETVHGRESLECRTTGVRIGFVICHVHGPE